MADWAEIQHDLKRNWVAYVGLAFMMPISIWLFSEFVYHVGVVDDFGGPVGLLLAFPLAVAVGLVIRYVGKGWIGFWPTSN
jgi:hypothetical protein